MPNRKIHVITLMVANEFGVLTRVTAQIRREGWNIRSLTVAETENPEVSRMTVSLDLRHSLLEHVVDRLSRLSSVHQVQVYSPETQVAQELCLVRVDGGNPAAIAALCGDYAARRLPGRDEHGGDVLLAAHCAPSEMGALLQRCREIGLRDVARSGTLVLDKQAPAIP